MTRTQQLFQTEFDEDQSAISPDGRWIAYQSNETGPGEIYVRPFPNFEDGGKWQISRDGGGNPFWGPDSNELFYRGGDRVIAVSVETEPIFSAGTPRVLFEGNYVALGPDFPGYGVSPDGQRFLMMKLVGSSGQESELNQFVIVENWFEELNRLTPSQE